MESREIAVKKINSQQYLKLFVSKPLKSSRLWNLMVFQSRSLKVDGGMVKNRKFLQLLSNTLSTNVKKPDQIESTAVGAFKIALLGSGIKNIDEIQEIGSYDEVKSKQSPQLNDDYQIWKNYLTKNL